MPHRRRVRSATALVTACLAVALASGCVGGSPEEPLACGILDREVISKVTGGMEVSVFGGADTEEERVTVLDKTRRQGNGVDCTVTTAGGGQPLLSVYTQDMSDHADWDAMRARLADVVDGSPYCVARTEPSGYACVGIDGVPETRIAALFDERWVRVVARHRDDRTPPPDPDVVLEVARDVDENITAYDAEH